MVKEYYLGEEQTMPDIYIIMGHSKSRKSATIMALTGASKVRAEGYEVATSTTTDIIFFIQTRSLQEKKISPEDFINNINIGNYANVLISLRINPANKKPNGLEYIRAFINVGWSIKQISVLGVQKLPYDLPSKVPFPKVIPDAKTMAANRIASQIRSEWGWL
jgi:hypothetical protein